jgi:glycosyltransferase involved in cell wall biosynthesis
LLAPQPFYQERGTPIAVKLLAETLGGMGHDVHLLVFAEGEKINLPGVTLHRHMKIPGVSGVKPGFSIKKLLCDFFLFLKCIQLVRKIDFHALHAVEESVFMALLVKKIFKIPYVYDMDSCMSAQLMDKHPSLNRVRRVLESIEKVAVQESVGVLPVCESLEKTVKTYKPEGLVVCLQDVSLLESGSRGTEDLRKTLGIHGTMVMYVGNFEKYQGIDLLLQSFAAAISENDNVYLVLIGGNIEDITLYEKKTQQLDIAQNVFFCGARPVSQLGYFLQQADILVSPRIQGENTPMKIYSYLDSGVPVLATRLTTHTQVLDETIAYLVDPTLEAMRDGLLFLAKNKKERLKIALNAKIRVEKEYSLQAFNRKLGSFYEKVGEQL